jgi:hypothetical protein
MGYLQQSPSNRKAPAKTPAQPLAQLPKYTITLGCFSHVLARIIVQNAAAQFILKAPKT